MTVRLRYKTPGEETSREIETQYLEEPRPASANMQWSAAVAAFGMLLRHSPHRGGASIPMVLELAQGGLGEDPHGHRREFVQLVQKLAPSVTGTTRPAEDQVPGRALRMTAEEAERIATRNGRYSNLLRVIPAAEDRELYGEVRDYGRWEGREYQGHANLPVGYWVYVAPNWYIWGDAAN